MMDLTWTRDEFPQEALSTSGCSRCGVYVEAVRIGECMILPCFDPEFRTHDRTQTGHLVPLPIHSIRSARPGPLLRTLRRRHPVRYGCDQPGFGFTSWGAHAREIGRATSELQ